VFWHYPGDGRPRQQIYSCLKRQDSKLKVMHNLFRLLFFISNYKLLRLWRRISVNSFLYFTTFFFEQLCSLDNCEFWTNMFFGQLCILGNLVSSSKNFILWTTMFSRQLFLKKTILCHSKCSALIMDVLYYVLKNSLRCIKGPQVFAFLVIVQGSSRCVFI